MAQINAKSSLPDIQNYLAEIIKERGFDQQTARDTLLILLEEVGELAKAIRKETGMAIDQTRLDSYGHTKLELADVFICLIILANKLNIDLFDALDTKEQINKTRTWSSHQQPEHPQDL